MCNAMDCFRGKRRKLTDAGPADGHELVAEGSHFAVESEAFQIDVSVAKDRETSTGRSSLLVREAPLRS